MSCCELQTLLYENTMRMSYISKHWAFCSCCIAYEEIPQTHLPPRSEIKLIGFCVGLKTDIEHHQTVQTRA